MKNEEILECLDALGLALAEHDHQWTPEQRSSYERCAAFLRVDPAADAIIILRRWDQEGFPPTREVA